MSTQENSFKVMETITEKVSRVLSEGSENHASSDYMKKLVKANEHFNALVEKGVITRRGNNLITLEEATKRRFTFNS